MPPVIRTPELLRCAAGTWPQPRILVPLPGKELMRRWDLRERSQGHDHCRVSVKRCARWRARLGVYEAGAAASFPPPEAPRERGASWAALTVRNTTFLPK